MKDSSNIINSLAHTKWNCKYHIVFAPKYRRKVFYDEHRLEEGLCPKNKNHVLCTWMIIFAQLTEKPAPRRGNPARGGLCFSHVFGNRRAEARTFS